MKLTPGDRLKDNDPRMPNRVLTVTVAEFDGIYFKAKDSRGRERCYLLDRVHEDFKPRRSGFSRIGK